ncbi:hypothetical protein [Azospirillum sp. B4]|uniref:hypothetical protein n=1 Tax=Azospirillum sp. B4 TaxID=95605 RepID=UPI00034A2979|nr:hypothetical protein [Azospirillum sp. B4]
MVVESVMIHVRFAPNGTVTEIGERPATLSPQDWFNHLSLKAGTHYQTFVGGRGLFRLPRPEIEDLKAAVAA